METFLSPSRPTMTPLSVRFCIVFLCFSLFQIGFSNSNPFYKFTNPCGPNSYLPSNTSETVDVTSSIECLAKCVSVTQNDTAIVCFGTNFDSGQNCELLLIANTTDLLGLNCLLTKTRHGTTYFQMEIYCPALTSRPGATLHGDPGNIIGSSRYYLCSGMTTPLPGATVQCLMSARWTEDSFQCPCGPLSVLNATFVPGSSAVGSRRGYVCDGQVTPVREAYLQCLPDSTWSVPVTRCVWPKRSFVLPKPSSGCPADFDDTYVRYAVFAGDRTSDNSKLSDGHHLHRNIGDPAYPSIQVNQCQKTNKYVPFDAYDWPKGTYCIVKEFYSSCPPGFSNGEILISYGNLKGDNYCCRRDATVATEMILPVHKPFYLHPYKTKACQAVRGMNSSLEFAFLEDIGEFVAITEPTPYIRFFGTFISATYTSKGTRKTWQQYTLNLYFCYYFPI